MLYGLGDKIGEFNLQQGENVEVSVDLRVGNIMGVGTDVKAWKVSKDGMGGTSRNENGNQGSNEIENGSKLSLDGDDIPF